MHYGKDKYIGYRGLDTTNCPVAYPFGHGLSYTNFAYPGFDLAICPVTESTGQDKPVLTVSNTGDRAGAAVPQVYPGFPDTTIDRCVRELKAFRRVELEPGQRQTVTVALTRRDLSYWDILPHPPLRSYAVGSI
ncbi:fibronectin type III-like domain-contianing protein [Cutibacterium acnes]